MRSALLDRLRKAGPRGAEYTERFGATGPSGERYEPEARGDYVDAYRDRIWVHRCVELIRSSFDGVPLRVKTKQSGEEWIEEHRLIDLLKRPNPRDPAITFFSWTLFWAEVVGDWFWEVVPARDGAPAELFPLRAHQVRIKAGSAGRPGGYIYDPDQNGLDPITYSALPALLPNQKLGAASGNAEEPLVIYGRYGNPYDDFYGMPPLRAAKDDIISEYYGVRYDHRFFRNSARPDVVIGFKQKLQPDQRSANKEEWNDFKGVDQAHRAAVMDGDPSINVLSQNQRDVEYLDGRRLAREGQTGAFGVPPVLVGILDRATYSNYETARIVFWAETMVPKFIYFATWANFTVVPFFEDVVEVGFDLSGVSALQQAEGWKSERIQGEIATGLATPDEGREELDREPLNTPASTSLYLPANLFPLGAANTPDAPPASEPGVDPGAAPEGTPPAANRLPAAHARKGVEEWLNQALMFKRRYAGRATTEVRAHFAAQRQKVLAIFASMEKSAELERRLREYGWSDDAGSLAKVLDAMATALSEEAFNVTGQLLNHEPSDGLLERVVREVGNRADGISGISKRVKSDVIEQVRTGIQHGLSFRQIADGGVFTSATQAEEQVTIKGVKGVYDEYTTWQAERIARTESGFTFNRASAALMHEAGVERVDITDGDSDEDCAYWNGRRVTLQEYESNPLGHPNCTRIGLPVIEVPKPGGTP